MRSRARYYMVAKRVGQISVLFGPTTYEAACQDAKHWSRRGWTCWVEEAYYV